MKDLRQELRKLALKDGRYSPDAFEFLFESLDSAVQRAGRGEEQGSDRHITGQELVEGLRHRAREAFGPLGAHVWRTWGVRQSLDWGQIVFLLVDNQLLNRRESDTIDDFREGFDFDAFFVDDYRFDLPAEIPPTPAGEAS